MTIVANHLSFSTAAPPLPPTSFDAFQPDKMPLPRMNLPKVDTSAASKFCEIEDPHAHFQMANLFSRPLLHGTRAAYTRKYVERLHQRAEDTERTARRREPGRLHTTNSKRFTTGSVGEAARRIWGDE